MKHTPSNRPPGFPDDTRVAHWLAFASTMSTQHLDYMHSWGHDLLESEKTDDLLFGGMLLRVVRLERELRDLAGDQPAGK